MSWIEVPTSVNVSRLDQYISTIALLVCIFCISVDAPSWGGPYLAWGWKGIVAAAAYYKGLHTDKPEKLS